MVQITIYKLRQQFSKLTQFVIKDINLLLNPSKASGVVLEKPGGCVICT